MKLWVSGIVARRNGEPYVMLQKDEFTIGQLSVAEARNFARDIWLAASNAEADAMILRFFQKLELPEQAGAAIMQDFRDFRAQLAGEDPSEGTVYQGDPPTGDDK